MEFYTMPSKMIPYMNQPNKKNLVRITSNMKYKGINMYDVTDLKIEYHEDKKMMRSVFRIRNSVIGFAVDDVHAFMGSKYFEYVLLINEEGCVLLRSWYKDV